MLKLINDSATQNMVCVNHGNFVKNGFKNAIFLIVRIIWQILTNAEIACLTV